MSDEPEVTERYATFLKNFGEQPTFEFLCFIREMIEKFEHSADLRKASVDSEIYNFFYTPESAAALEEFIETHAHEYELSTPQGRP